MSLTVQGSVLDNLYALLAAEATLAAAVTSGALAMFNGPPTIEWSATTILVVGGRAHIDDDSPVQVSWDWQAMGVSGGFADVNETIDVPLGFGVIDGGSNFSTARTTLYTYYAAAAAAVRNSTLSIPQVLWCIPSAATVHQLATPTGVNLLLDWTAHVRAQI